MSEGPTTVGSIVGKLKLDISEWTAKAEEAKAIARDIGRDIPDFKVKGDLNGATRDVKALGSAEEEVGKKAEEAGKKAENAGRQMQNGAQGAVPWMGILVGAISAVSPGMVAVGAASIAVSAEMAGLGAAGLLAFKGIQTGITASLPMFSGLSEALDGVQSTLINLEMTAAGGVLSGLSAALKTVQADAAPLTATVALLSGQLGGLLATAADTAVHAVNGFTPVLVASGSALQGFLNGVNQFTQSNGFTDFVNYAVARLPDVMHLIDSALGAVGSIFSNLAPGGQATLFMLSSLVDLLKSLAPVIGAVMPVVIGVSAAIGGLAIALSTIINALGPVGSALIGTAGAFVGLGFAARALAPAVLAAAASEGVAATATTVLGAAIDFAMGPVGLLIIGAGLLAGAIANVAGSSQKTAADVSQVTAAIQQDSGVVGENTKNYIANNLIKNGADLAAQRLGISMKTLTAASTGNVAANKQVTASLEEQRQHLITLGDQGKLKLHQSAQFQQDSAAVKNAIASENDAVQKATDSYNKVAKATGQATMSAKQMAAAAAAVHMPVDQFAEAAAAQDKVAGSAEKARNKLILEGDAAALLKLDMDKLTGASISDAEAQGAAAAALDGFTLKSKNGKAALEGHSNAAKENRASIASMATTLETAVQSTANLTHSVSQTTAQYKSYRAQLIETAVQQGATRAEATKLADAYFKLPKNIKTDFLGNDADAIAKAAAAKKAGQDFAKGDYKAALKADPTPANKSAAQAMKAAEAFAIKKYLAQYEANPTKANLAALQAAEKAHGFATGFYMAYLKADATGARNGADAAKRYVEGVHGKTVSIDVTTYFRQVGKGSLANRYGAHGGTAGSSVFGMAAGGSPDGFGGTVTGPGTAASDTAGLYALANGEEVISNLRGQADKWRPLLKAINAGKVDSRAFEAMAAHRNQGPTNHTTIAPEIHVHNPVAVDPVQQAAEAAQLALAYAGLG